MKNKYIYSALALALTLTGCDYNDKYFDGLEDLSSVTQIVKKDYVLTEADYNAIASNSTNINIAKASDASAQLANLKTSFKFNEIITAEKYIPAFLAAKYIGADNGSAIHVTFNQSVAAPDYLSDVEQAKLYTLSEDDYKQAWPKGEAVYFTSAKPAANFLPSILKNKINGAVEGDYAIATYLYSKTEPSVTPEEGETFVTVTDVVNGENGAYNVKATVVATYARGFLISDGKSYVLVYLNATPNVAIGDAVVVKGTTTTYGGFKQFPADSEITRVAGSESYKVPTYAAMDAAKMDAYLTSASITPVSYTGKLTISGSYYNVAIEGATTAVGSIQYPAPGVVDPALNGKEVTVYGYTVGVSSKKFVNTMAMSVVEAGSTRNTIAEAVLGAVGDYAVQGAVLATYARGFLLGDGANSILVYKSDTGVVPGDIVSVKGTTSKYGGLSQFSNKAEVNKLGTATIKLPTPYAISATEMDEYIASPYVRYITYSGKLTVSGSYFNVAIKGATTAVGSLQYVNADQVEAITALNGKDIVVTGYAVGASGSKYVNTMITSVVEATAAASVNLLHLATRAGSEVSTESHYAIYKYVSGSWVIDSNVAVVDVPDYTEMGQKYPNFSSTANPDNYLPAFMRKAFPYAQEGDVKAVAYNYYTTKTSVRADEYIYSNGAWTKNNYVQTVTKQFVLSNNAWKYDPSLSIVLPYGKGQALSTKYYQAITDWVIENHPEYVTSYKNNDYYYGGSAYQNDFDFRPSAWKNQNADAYGSMSDSDLVNLMWQRLPEAWTRALATLHADLEPIEGIDVTVTINFVVYDGSANTEYTIKYKVIGKGQFEYVENSLQKV